MLLTGTSKGERERYTQLNAEFQRIARTGKKEGASSTYRAVPRTKGESYQGRAVMEGWNDRSCGL